MESKTVITVQCAWCGKPLGEKDGQGVSGVSDGMCSECYNRLTEDMELAEATRSRWNEMADFGYADAAADMRDG